MQRLAASSLVLIAACAGASEAPVTGPPAAASAAPAAGADATATGSFHSGRFPSSALGVVKQYYVYLPPGYEASDRRYPVVYMLHGLGGDENNWRQLDIGPAADEVALEAIIVMPDGDDGFYVNWASEVDHEACLRGSRPFGQALDMRTYCVRQARYEDYIARDLVAHVDATYRTIPERDGRAIGGLSMGGYGALYLAMKHPDLFGATASHAGVTSLLYQGPHPYQRDQVVLTEEPGPWLDQAGAFGDQFRRIWATDIATWRAHDPATMATELTEGQLAIYLDCGDQDEFKLHAANQYMHDVLTEAGISHSFELIEGGRHDARFWTSRVDDSLRFFAAYFAASVPAPR